MGKSIGSVTLMSQLFARTLRDAPADAEVESHKLLVRAGYIRQVAPGIFTWLPLGLKVLRKVEAIVREEMEAIGCEELHFPALLPREPYETTNRWTEYGKNIFRLKDRRESDYLLAPTHEEMFALIVKDMLNSYKDFPVALFQIQTKYRDEARPRAGLLRGREFIMKDAYSFDLTDEGLAESYQKQRGAYQKIFDRLGLPYTIVHAMSGAMGGSNSEEFLSPTQVGEDTFVEAPSGYAANVEAADIKVPADLSEAEIAKLPALEEVATPGAKSIEEVSAVVGSNPENMLKAVYLTLMTPAEAEGDEQAKPEERREVVICCIPGDRELDMKRAEAVFAPAEVEQSTPEDLKAHPELVPGFVGPFTSKDARSEVKFYFDKLVNAGSSWVTGGNAEDKHRKNVVAARDFSLTDADGNDLRLGLAAVREGDEAADGSGKLTLKRGVEIGHIFALGKKYTEAFGVQVQGEDGKMVTPTMGSYGIGVTRAIALLAEDFHDEKGLAWPRAVAPADVQIVIASKEYEALAAARGVADELAECGIDVILDDRQASPGVKFKDAELIGVPLILVFGRGLQEEMPKVELKNRDGSDLEIVDLPDVVRAVQARAVEAVEVVEAATNTDIAE